MLDTPDAKRCVAGGDECQSWPWAAASISSSVASSARSQPSAASLKASRALAIQAGSAIGAVASALKLSGVPSNDQGA